MSKTIVILVLIVLIAVIGIKYLPKNINKQPEQGQNNGIVNPAPSGKVLDLSNRGLTKVPADVFSKTGIEELNLTGNQLTGALPGEIRFLSNLRVLNVSNNQMTGVPAEVGQLSKLEVLDLSNNQLTGLPYELGNLKNLKRLKLSGNNYSQQDLAIIKKALPASVIIE